MIRPHIEQFIERFKYGFDKKAIEDCFLNGNCYHFAVILKNIYPEGEIVEDVVFNHFMLKLNGKYYDIAGEMTPHSESWLYNWGEHDSIRDERVKSQCVYLDGRNNVEYVHVNKQGE